MSKIVEAVGVATWHSMRFEDPVHHGRLQQTMLDAADRAKAEGINDPDVIRERMLAARDRLQAPPEP